MITPYTIAMAVLWSSLFIVLLFFLRRSTSFVKNFGTTALVMLLVGGGIRLVLPFEFSFTKIISSDTVYAAISTALRTPLIEGTEFTAKNIMKILWPVVTVAFLGIMLTSYVVSVRRFSRSENIIDERTKKIADEVGKKFKSLKAEVILSREIPYAMSVGVFKRYIFLPVNSFSDKDLEVILTHEYTHLKNRDTLIKFLVHLCVALFWWNPLVYLLYVNLGQVLEIKCDLEVTAKMSTEERIGYLTAMKNVIASFANNSDGDDSGKKRPPVMATAEFTKPNGRSKSGTRERDFYQRIELIRSYEPNVKRQNIMIALVGTLMVVLLFFSYTFVLQPYYHIPEEDYELSEGDYVLNAEDLSPTLLIGEEANYFLLEKDEEVFCILIKSEETFNVVSEDKLIVKIEYTGEIEEWLSERYDSWKIA